MGKNKTGVGLDEDEEVLQRGGLLPQKASAAYYKFDMKYTTDYKLDEVKKILTKQLDSIPSNWWTRYRKTTPICGKIDGKRFELRNNTFHMYSLRAHGEILSESKKTIIEIEFKKPPFFYNLYGSMLGRYNEDRRIIVAFLEEWLNLKVIN